MSTPSAPTADAEDRAISPYSTREKFARLLWAFVQTTLFRPSFHNWYAWRSFLLTRFGARLGTSVRIRRTVRVECPWNLSAGSNCSVGDHAILYCLGPVTLGDRVSISQNAHICAGSHDHTRPDLPLTRPPITIHSDAWIAADAFVGPGVTVAEGAILGARACAFKDVPPWTIFGGNPARKIADRPPLGNQGPTP